MVVVFVMVLVDEIVLIDCVMFWLMNVMLGDYDFEVEIWVFLVVIEVCLVLVIIVLNEIGLGIVFDNKLVCDFWNV